MDEGTKFKPILVDNYGNGGQDADKVIVCSGKVYFDIHQILDKADLHHKIKVIRVEELAPFPYDLINSEIQDSLDHGADVYWVQEESMNEGAF